MPRTQSRLPKPHKFDALGFSAMIICDSSAELLSAEWLWQRGTMLAKELRALRFGIVLKHGERPGRRDAVGRTGQLDGPLGLDFRAGDGGQILLRFGVLP